MTRQAMPHYVGTCKMHKDPPGMRFISSSNTSSMRSVSLMIDKLLTQLPPGMLRLRSGSQQHRCLHVTVVVMEPVMLAISSSMTLTQ